MSPNDSDSSKPETPSPGIEKAAADWFVRHDRGLSPAQRQEFARWLEADARHAAIFAELEGTWNLLRRSRVPAPGARSRGSPAFGLKLAWVSAAWAAAALVVLAGAAGWRRAHRTAPFSGTAITAVGELRRMELADGSVVQLNTDSAVEVIFTPGERSVRLIRGEAQFQVAKNPARPFVVRANGVSVRAVGTAFDVHLSSDAVDILVTEGKVQVADSRREQSLLPAPPTGATPLLGAGQRARIPLSAAAGTPVITAVARVEVERELAWREGRLEFRAEPLGDIVNEFNRYNRHQLVIADPRLAQRRFGGTFPVSDYEALVRSLEADFGVVAARGENETRLSLAP